MEKKIRIKGIELPNQETCSEAFPEGCKYCPIVFQCKQEPHRFGVKLL